MATTAAAITEVEALVGFPIGIWYSTFRIAREVAKPSKISQFKA